MRTHRHDNTCVYASYNNKSNIIIEIIVVNNNNNNTYSW